MKMQLKYAFSVGVIQQYRRRVCFMWLFSHIKIRYFSDEDAAKIRFLCGLSASFALY